PARLRALLEATERDVLYVVIFSLAYEFDLGTSKAGEDGPKRSLAILHALDERLETSSILFPKLELLTPEDAALLVDGQRAEDLSLFPTYVELLYSMSTANADLADKKARIAARIVELRDAVALFYLRGERADPAELCAAIDTLASATADALLWAVSDVQRSPARTSVAAAYRVEVSVAVTNTSPDRAVMVGPRAAVRLRHDDETTATIAVEDTRLADQDLLDNNVPPGFTQVRSFEGMANEAVIQGCTIALELVIDGARQRLDVEIAPCPGG
ncbi:MAG: hypothetical protein KC636_39715, partial [Myxococcales bacterium]|nr:hypothetical protein [Myxococcales bacterium]